LHFGVTENEIICMQIFDKSELKFLKNCQEYSVQNFCRFYPSIFNLLHNSFYASTYRPSVPVLQMCVVCECVCVCVCVCVYVCVCVVCGVCTCVCMCVWCVVCGVCMCVCVWCVCMCVRVCVCVYIYFMQYLLTKYFYLIGLENYIQQT
jgi:hypothetical protein